MNYYTQGAKIIVEDIDSFDCKHILDSGQVFRYREHKDYFEVFSKNMICVLKYEKNRVIIENSDNDYFINYFDLNRDYSLIKANLNKIDTMAKPLKYGYGIRILNQWELETIISFIISSNNNIPRIKGIIDKICIGLGEKQGEYYAFPTLQALARTDEQFFTQAGAGYRARYLVKTIKAINEGYDIALKNLCTESARKRLMCLMGIGRKVADCILLFAYHKSDVFPVDTWIKKVYKDLTNCESSNIIRISEELSTMFGNFAGYAQQYLFYYYRETQ